MIFAIALNIVMAVVNPLMAAANLTAVVVCAGALTVIIVRGRPCRTPRLPETLAPSAIALDTRKAPRPTG